MVAIKNMEMPNKCGNCSLCGSYNGGHNYCKYTGNRIMDFSKRADNCPLIEIQERKTGEWVYEYDNGVSAVYHCSVCGKKLVVLRDDTVENYPYCHCGTEMRGNN